jgi:hypothetical protein
MTVKNAFPRHAGNRLILLAVDDLLLLLNDLKQEQLL